jgi:hypothetical protein
MFTQEKNYPLHTLIVIVIVGARCFVFCVVPKLNCSQLKSFFSVLCGLHFVSIVVILRHDELLHQLTFNNIIMVNCYSIHNIAIIAYDHVLLWRINLQNHTHYSLSLLLCFHANFFIFSFLSCDQSRVIDWLIRYEFKLIL